MGAATTRAFNVMFILTLMQEVGDCWLKVTLIHKQ